MEVKRGKGGTIEKEGKVVEGQFVCEDVNMHTDTVLVWIHFARTRGRGFG